MKLLEEFHELKADFLTVRIEEKATHILNLFMFNDMSNFTIPSTLFESRNVEASVEVKPRKGKKKRSNNEDDETHKMLSIVATQKKKIKKLVAESECLWDTMLMENSMQPSLLQKKKSIINFGIQKGTR